MESTCRHCGAQLALGAVACFRCGRIVDGASGSGTTGSGAGSLPTELSTLAKQGLLEGQWRLLSPIGLGQSGAVFEGQDVALDRRVAIKILHESLRDDAAQVARFEREVRVLARMDHPNLTPVLGSGTFEGRPFVVMRLLVGRTVAELLHQRGGKLSLPEVSFCLLPVVDALKVLHDAGVVHRDLKPSNVFVSESGQVTLLDLGQVFEAGSDLTRLGQGLRGAEYLSPEQAAGRPVDGRSDAYSLGCLMYELIHGRPPFTGPLPELLLAHQNAARPALEGLPPEVASLLAGLLSVEPEPRPSLDVVRGVLQHYAPVDLALPPMVFPSRAAEGPAFPLSTTREDATTPMGAPLVAAPAREPDTTPVLGAPALVAARAAAPSEPPSQESEVTQYVARNPVSVLVRPPEPSALAPSSDESTVVGVTRALAREVVTRPTERPLSPRAMLAMMVSAAVLLLAIVVGMGQRPESIPQPVRVDQPTVEAPVKAAPPPAPVAAPKAASSAAPPARAVVEAPAAVLPALGERKEAVNAFTPGFQGPKRGRLANRGPVPKGAVRIITTVGPDEISCRLFIDGTYVGRTPYVSGTVRQGEHLIKAVCTDWAVEEVVWPFPSPEKQKVGLLVELPIAALGASRPISGVGGSAHDPADAEEPSKLRR